VLTVPPHISVISTAKELQLRRGRGKRAKKKERNRGESVAGVGNQQAGFADSAVSDGDALYEPGRTHFQIKDLHKQQWLQRT